jgi:hypothetical protein
VGDWIGRRRFYHSGRSCRTILRIPSNTYIRFNNVPTLQPRRTRLPAVLELRHLVLLPPLTSPSRRRLHLPIDSSHSRTSSIHPSLHPATYDISHHDRLFRRSTLFKPTFSRSQRNRFPVLLCVGTDRTVCCARSFWVAEPEPKVAASM